MPASREELTRLLALYREERISEQQLLERIESLDGGELQPQQDRAAVDLLDAYRAAEASGAETLAAWARLSNDPALVGGLRTAAARESKHAALLEQRVRELGGSPMATIPDWLVRYNARITDPEASDLDRLAAIVEQFPDVDRAAAPLLEAIDTVIGDELTRELLRTICADELSTVKWAHEAYRARKP